jgi:hypothetical protein
MWKDLGCRTWNQWIVPPAEESMHEKHPCFAENSALIRCSEDQPDSMKLAGRCAVCNEPRQKLMVCLTKNKNWVAPKSPKPWYQLW